MSPLRPSRKRGATLVFVLLGLIIVLALGVVMLSRLSRSPAVVPGKVEPAVTEEPVLTAEPVALPENGATSATEAGFPAADTTAIQQIPPPPAPANVTPDPKSLPPEG